MFSSLVSVEPQYGQRKTPALQLDERRRRPPRAAPAARSPAARSFSRPSGVIRSVDHESSEHHLDRPARRRARGSASAIASRITSSAGQPRNVGVNSTCTRPSSTCDVADDAEVDERDDRDLRVRDLGERLPDLRLGHHVAPGGASGAPSSSRPSSSAQLGLVQPRSTGSTSGRRADAASTRARTRAAARRRARRGRTARAPRPPRGAARLVARSRSSHISRACGGRPPRGRSSPRGRRRSASSEAFSASSRIASAVS